MSLDVSLYLDSPPLDPRGGSGIFVRRNGATVEISREEWDRDFAGQEPVVASIECGSVYERNITHNLNKMADAAGVYYACWRPEERCWSKANEIIQPLELGLKELRAAPERFKAYNPSNGWGDYDGLVAFVADYLEACKRYPEATICVSR